MQPENERCSFLNLKKNHEKNESKKQGYCAPAFLICRKKTQDTYHIVVREGKEQTMCSVLNEIQEKGRSEGHTEGWMEAKNCYLAAIMRNLMKEDPSLSEDAARKRALQLLGLEE